MDIKNEVHTYNIHIKFSHFWIRIDKLDFNSIKNNSPSAKSKYRLNYAVVTPKYQLLRRHK